MNDYVLFMVKINDDDGGFYFEIFDNMEDLVATYGDVDIYRACLNNIGKYKIKKSVVKIKQRKKRAAK